MPGCKERIETPAFVARRRTILHRIAVMVPSFPLLTQRKKAAVYAAVALLVCLIIAGPGAWWIQAHARDQKRSLLLAQMPNDIPLTQFPTTPVAAISVIAGLAIFLLVWIIRWLFGKVDQIQEIKQELAAVRAELAGIREAIGEITTGVK